MVNIIIERKVMLIKNQHIKIFKDWVRQFLIKELKLSQIIIIHNVSHIVKEARSSLVRVENIMRTLILLLV